MTEAEDRLSRLQANLPGAMVYQVLIHPDGRRQFTHISAGVETLHGISVEEALGDAATLYQQVDPADLPTVAALEEEALRTMQTFRVEVRFHPRGGSMRWALLSSAPRPSPEGGTLWDGLEVDITAQKLLEEKLRATEAALLENRHVMSTLFDSTSDLIWYVDVRDWKVLGFNQAVVQLLRDRANYRISVGSDTGKFIQDEDVLVQWHGYYQRAVESGGFSVETGSLIEGRCWLLSFSPLLRNGEVFGVAGFGRDITALRSSDASRLESEARYRHIVEDAPIGIYRRRIGQGFEYVNNRMVEQFACSSAEELISLYRNVRTHWVDVKDHDDFVMQLRRDRQVVGREACVRLVNGELRWFQLYAFFEEGSDSLFSGFTLDVTQRRKAEEALRTQQEFTQTLFELAPFFVVAIDQLGRVRMMNRTMLQALGYEASEVEGEQWLERFLPEAEQAAERCILERAASETVTFKRESRVVTRSGELLLCEWHGIPVFAGKEHAYLLNVGLDITERRRLELEFNRQQEQVHQSQKMEAVGQLAGGVAHDFNNSLAGIMGAAELLLESDSLSASERLEYVNLILTAAERAGELTKKLLAFSRKGTKVSTAVDLGAIVNDVAAILRRTLDRRVVVEVENRATCARLIGDDALLQNAIMNLGINAGHAMPEGGVLTFTIENTELDEVYCQRAPLDIAPGEYVLVSVRDTGCGMPPEVQGRIFEPFFTTKSQGKGTGLGLSAVYGTVRDHRGMITVYSEVNVGSLFNLYFPIDRTGRPVSSPVPPVPRGTGRVLVVDDEELIRLTARAMLESLGYEVVIAENGAAAVELLAASPSEIDLVLLDMIMPVMGGRDAFERLRSIRSDLPIVISSGFSKEEDLRALWDRGAVGFLHKPFRKGELAQVVADVRKQGTPQAPV